MFSIQPQAMAIKGGNVMSADDRAAALQALTAIKKDQWRRAENLIAGTRDPLAAKLYYWLAYTENPRDATFSRISGFIEQNPDWPRQTTMRINAEKALDRNVNDKDVITWFDRYSPLTSEGMEHYLDALERQKKFDKARQVARTWWADTMLTPDRQSRFLKRYGRYLDENTHRIRLDRQLFAGHYSNARVIARILGRGYPALAEARIAVASDAPGVDRKIASVPPHLADDPGLAYERLRWRRRHDRNIGALEILHNPPAAEKIANLPDWWRERHIMARRLMEEGRYESAYLLVSKHQQTGGFSFAQAEFLAGWLALRFTKEPWRAFEHFEALYHHVSTPISRARGAYWAGRASEDLGYPEIARKWYRVAARHQTAYYGQLALATLDDEYKPPRQLPPKRVLAVQNEFNRAEMVQVTRILSKAGFRQEVSGFLRAMAEKITAPEEFILIADLAQELEHFHDGVYIAKKGLGKNIMMMDYAYPTMLARMESIDLEWALVHAIIRQESAFDYEARSPAGARGLMQLMPATAKGVARRKGWSHKTSWLTSRPDHNIRLGAAYMEQMIRRFDGSYALAAAAYNGGPGRVDRWLEQFGDPRKGEIDILDWVELIPVYETRNYVQRVLEGVYVYRIKFGDVQTAANAPIHVAYGNR